MDLQREVYNFVKEYPGCTGYEIWLYLSSKYKENYEISVANRGKFKRRFWSIPIIREFDTVPYPIIERIRAITVILQSDDFIKIEYGEDTKIRYYPTDKSYSNKEKGL